MKVTRFMKSEGIRAVKQRLAKAEAAFERFHEGEEFQQKRMAWSDFLLAVNSIYSKLEQSAKGCAKSSYWYGLKKSERKLDPLLCYLHHARNADDHGISNTENFVTKIKFRLSEEFLKRAETKDEFVPIAKLGAKDDEPFIDVQDATAGEFSEEKFIALADVRDRGRTYEPPSEHFGEVIRGFEKNEVHWSRAEDVIVFAMKYMKVLVYEASKLPTH